jgi:hypothetical protein
MGISMFLDNSEYLIPGFLPDGKPLMLPSGTILVYNGGKWALYSNTAYNTSWLAIRARYQNILGWKIRTLAFIATIQWADSYIKSNCSQCLEEI